MADDGSYEQLSNSDLSYVTIPDQDYSIATMSNCDTSMSDIGTHGKRTTSCHADVPAIVRLYADNGIFKQPSYQDRPLAITTDQDYCLSNTLD